MQVSRYWRMNAQRYMPNSGVTIAPDVQDDEAFTISGRGTVYAFTTVFDAPAGFTHFKPYIVGLIKTDEGAMVTAQLTDVDSADVEIGMPVEMVTRKIRTEGDEGMIVYGYKFRPMI